MYNETKNPNDGKIGSTKATFIRTKFSWENANADNLGQNDIPVVGYIDQWR